MTDKQLRILFLKTKLIHESEELSFEDFYNLIKDKIGWKEYNKIYSEDVNNSLLDYKTHTKLTELGKNTLIALESELEQEKKDKSAERKKLHNESILSDWKRKTFWYIFAFGLFGGVYSGFDLANKLLKNEKSNDTKPSEQITESNSQNLTSIRDSINAEQIKKDTLTFKKGVDNE